MRGVRTTMWRGSEGDRETASIWPFFGATWRLGRREGMEAQAPVQSTNCFAWRMLVGVWISMALLTERVERTAVLGRRSMVVACTAGRSAGASWRGAGR